MADCYLVDCYLVVPGDINTLTGGYGYDRRLLQELRALGHRVELISLLPSFPQPDATALAHAAAQFAALPSGAKVVVDGLALGVLPDLAEQEAARLQLIALCHHPLMLEAGLSAEAAQALFVSEQRALAATRAIIVTSPNTAKILVDQFLIAPDKIKVALPGTDAQSFAPCSGEPPQLLCVATLTRRKAHDVLIAAFARLRHLPWQLRLVGGAEFDPAWALQLQQQVSDLGLQQRICFVGSLNDLTAEYRAADLFVLPSHYEGYGMVFAEAISFGLPIVAARAGAVPEVVPETAGLLVPPNDIAALAAALEQLLTDPAARRRLQQGAQHAAQQLNRWQDTAQCVAAVLTEQSLHRTAP